VINALTEMPAFSR